MKYFSSLLLVLFISFGLAAQVARCGTYEHDALMKKNNAAYAENRRKIDEFITTYISKHHEEFRSSRSIITIPCVIHVVYKTDEENISDEQIFSQFAVLNNDFRLLNSDTSNIPAAFRSLAADCQIEFCLATVDPSGDSSTGIVRVLTDNDEWTDNDHVKSSLLGGDDAWSASDYLNIWVCNLTGLLGYTQFPGGPPETDGIVVRYTAFGTEGKVNPPFHLGRTTTHEIGHWLNLYHVWGDESLCAGSDSVDDTPNQATATFGCPDFPKLDACTPDSPGIMFNNYLDYTNDSCMNMFTQGQLERMNAMFAPGGPRYSILSSPACGTVTIPPYDGAVTGVINPSGISCTTSITPLVVIQNRGSASLVSATIQYAIDGGSPVNFNWIGLLGHNEEENVVLPSASVPEGPHTIHVELIDPDGHPDQDLSDNAVNHNFIISITGGVPPLQQGFEAIAFPYPGYLIDNPDGFITWERTSAAASAGNGSVFVENFNNTETGAYDDMILPATDLSADTAAWIAFDVAYARYSGTSSDTLEVLVSNTCGDSWDMLYKKYQASLETAPISHFYFIPDENQWRRDSIPLNAYLQPDILVMFRNITGFQNNLYIDQINLSGLMIDAVHNYNDPVELTVFPNPASDALTVALQSAFAFSGTLLITNVLGQKVYASQVSSDAGKSYIQISLEGFQAGMYHVTVKTENSVSVASFVKE